MAEELMVLEQDNASELETPGESVQEFAETENPVTETESDAEDQQSPIAGLTAEQIAEIPEIQKLLETERKSIEARLSESFRQREETARERAAREAAERAYNEQVARASQQDVSWAFQGLAAHLRDSSDQGKDPDPREIAKVASGLEERSRVMQSRDLQGYGPAVIQQFYPDFKLPPEYVQQFNQAAHSGNVRGLVTALMAQVALAQHERSAKWAVEQYQQEQEKVQQESASVEKQKQASATRRAGPRPAAITGQSPSGRSLDDILLDPMASEADKQAAFRKKHGL